MTTAENDVCRDLQATSWSGSIPIVLSLAPTSLSSPTMPASLHVLVSRNTFLHVGLEKAVMRLYKFAPVSFPSNSLTVRSEPDPGDASDAAVDTSKEKSISDNYPVCWFEDEETQFALRWHLFVGVLWDLKAGTKRLPWKIRLHFTSYPSSQILPLDGSVLKSVEQTYMNSLKQALFLQHGSNKVAMNMSKQNHERIWDSIVTSNYQLYQQVEKDLVKADVNLIPVRLLIDSKPTIQRRIEGDAGTSLGSLLLDWVPELFETSGDGDSIQSKSDTTVWSVQGINVPLSASIVDLWKSVCCPDHFLYILIVSTTR